MNSSTTKIHNVTLSPKATTIRRHRSKPNRSLKDLIIRHKDSSLQPMEESPIKKMIKPLNISHLKFNTLTTTTDTTTRKHFELASSTRTNSKKNTMNSTQVIIKSCSNTSIKKSNTLHSSSALSIKKSFPISPKIALTEFFEDLTDKEKSEILEYPEVYFIAKKDCRDDPPPFTFNDGYDDNKGDYCLYKGDHIAYRYEIHSILGKGSFGQVCLCFDHKRKENVAIKIIKNKKRFHFQASFEIRILQSLLENDPDDKRNIVRIKNYFLFRNHICIAFELLQINLYQLLHKNHFNGVSLKLIKKIAIQLLVSLQFLAENQVIHCDLKPENILLKKPDSATIKIIDFGSSCFENEKIHTYIQSRFYRSPEIILGISYTTAIDMWSLGCILAELYTGQPIFPGRSEEEQFALIMEVIGAPPKSFISQATRNKTYFYPNGEPKLIADTKGLLRVPGSRSLNELLKGSNPNFINFVQQCFEWNPELRLTASQGLEHPWIIESSLNSSLLLKRRFSSERKRY
ncbi:unnamed protein product [Blepharisma stoltei]|uniref:dual-specificity kinase n=1 Tax=Blepharisma stoltei TaxID=1481888 RepID=A0AAU9IH12_9CILI|nr:unnamed protein product [Blepharisma stoltei]